MVALGRNTVVTRSFQTITLNIEIVGACISIPSKIIRALYRYLYTVLFFLSNFLQLAYNGCPAKKNSIIAL